MNINKLHFVYLVPSDRQPLAEPYIRGAAEHMQAFCQWQMGNAKTFDFVYNRYRTSHPAEWYSTFTSDPNTPRGEWYWGNALTEARDCAGAHFYMPNDSWVVYLDAPVGEGQHAGGASVNGTGICVLHAKDVAAIMGKDPDWKLCRAIGGGLHEALHTLGLPHPPSPPNPDWEKAVMGIGYMTYPNAILTENDKVTLNHHRFFSVHALDYTPHICPFQPHPVKPPRPHPLPVVRPVQRQAPF